MSAPESTEPRNDAEVEARAVAAERLTFFSDAVIAIALTLLALELPVPEGWTNAELWHAAGEHREEYVAFLVSFMVIAARWGAHHRVFRWVTSLGGRLSLLNMYWLLMQVITPFSTKVLTGDGAFQLRFAFYAGVQGLSFLLFLAMMWQIRKHGLARPDTPQDVWRHSVWVTGWYAVAFLVSIPVALFTTYAYWCWAVAPILSPVAERLLRKRS